MYEVLKILTGKTSAGEPVYSYTLRSRYGSVEISSLGASIQRIVVPDRGGNATDVVLGFEDAAGIAAQNAYIGATIGRCANRIALGELRIGQRVYPLQVNSGKSHLHGGDGGFHSRVWTGTLTTDGLVFSRRSSDLEEGYPGNLDVSVAFHWNDEGSLRIRYTAQSDADTAVNLTNHAYFNLSGHLSGEISDHLLQLQSERFTANDEDSLPDGTLRSVEGTPMDFRQLHPIGERIDADDEQLRFGGGYDHNFILEGGMEGTPVATAISPRTGIRMDVFTDMPGIQFYSGNQLQNVPVGKDGAQYGYRSAFCLETQYWPNAFRHRTFPSPILRAGERYNKYTVYQFSVQ